MRVLFVGCPPCTRCLRFQAETTEVVLTLIGNGLEHYNREKGDEDSWKRMDESVYLLMAVEMVGATAQVSEQIR